MARIDTFTFKVNRDERLLIERLAQRLQRTQSDAMRFLIREAARALADDHTGQADQVGGELCKQS